MALHFSNGDEHRCALGGSSETAGIDNWASMVLDRMMLRIRRPSKNAAAI
jgi:hypothetical protein